MTHRKVDIVEFARECNRPSCIPRVRLSGTAARGMAYERALAKMLTRCLPGVKHGQWYSYKADGQHGFCQPDFVFSGDSATYVLECKLTDIEKATEQLLDLYFPILAAAHGGPVRGIIVARSIHRVPVTAMTCTTLAEAFAISTSRVPILHWIGRGQL